MSINEGFVEVWQSNLQFALDSIKLVSQTNYVIGLDTEFPGDPLGSDHNWMIRGRRQEAYDIMKRNVDVTNMVTLGLYIIYS